MADLSKLLEAFAQNAALAIVLAYGFSVVRNNLETWWPVAVPAAGGLLFGGIAILCMETPLRVAPGILLDQRNLVVFLAGPFVGPAAGLLAGALAGAFRLYLGGVGAVPGFGAIMTAAALGAFIAWRFGALENARKAALAGLALTVATEPWILTIGDLALGWSILKPVAVPFAVFYVLGCVLLAGLLMIDERRRRSERELAQSNARFRDLAETTSDWFWETDAAHRFHYISPRFTQISGRPKSEIIGKTREELWGQPALAALVELRGRLDRHEPFRAFSYGVPGDDGRCRYVSVSGMPVFDDTGRFTGYRGSAVDATQAVADRRKLEAAMLAAEAANRAKTEFLATMSHELRTPLNAIIGFSDIMRQELFGRHDVENYRSYAEDIHASGAYLLDLISDMLDISRIEAGRLVLERSDHCLRVILDGATGLVRERAARAQVKLRYLPEKAEVVVNADARAIKQVLVNLLANAIKFTKPGGEVRVSVREGAGGSWIVAVADTGVGIPAEDLQKVLRPFEQSRSTLYGETRGTGLGLAISKALVEAHGGTLTLSSRVGVGTVVEIVVPGAGKPAIAA